MINEMVELIDKATEIVWFYRQQYYYTASIEMKEFIGMLSNLLSLSNDIDTGELGMEMIILAQENQDYILVADVLEASTIPCLEKAAQTMELVDENNYLEDNLNVLKKRGLIKEVELIKNADRPQNADYVIEQTASGHKTIRLTESGKSFYLSGNNNPHKDALAFAQGNIEEDVYKYTIFGMGLLHEVEAILKIRPDAEVNVVETDFYLIRQVFSSRKLEKIISDDRVTFLLKEDATEIGNIRDTYIIVLRYFIRHQKEGAFKESLEHYFINSMTIKEQGRQLDENFKRNIQKKELIHSIDEIKDDFKGKNVYIIGGGPSLDKSLSIIKNKEEDAVLICVGTTSAKLMKYGIVPEYILITDSRYPIKTQLENCPSKELSKLLYLSTSYYGAVEIFSGEKYAVFQSEYEKSENYANHKGYTLFETGGSVSTTAIDIALRLKCKEIKCFGLDMAFTGNKSHASGTIALTEYKDESVWHKIQGVNGEMLNTSMNLLVYHKWIERRIKDETIKITNYSNGAYIKGMKNVSLLDD